MSDVPSDLLLSLLREPTNALAYGARTCVEALRPGAYILETTEELFDPSALVEAGGCVLTPSTELPPSFAHGWPGHGEPVVRTLATSWSAVAWRNEQLEVVRLVYSANFRDITLSLVVARDRAVAEAFFEDVCAHGAELRDEVLVYANGCWNKSKELYAAIERARFEDVVLAPGLADRLCKDFDGFLASREQYEAWGIPWKRGALFVGPPGNGKTSAIKALVRHLRLPCLYVQSFVAPNLPPQVAIREVFDRARRTAPCVIVLEDLDALVTDETRSFFLNELDGFAGNAGIVTIGSTNHADRLDPAIVDRPSRFDRKYHFDLPGTDERRRYVMSWVARLPPALALAPDDVDAVAGLTDGFSFAYLKELFASALMRLTGDADRGLATLLREEGEALRSQMATAELVPEPSPTIAEDDSPYAGFGRRRR